MICAQTAGRELDIKLGCRPWRERVGQCRQAKAGDLTPRVVQSDQNGRILSCLLSCIEHSSCDPEDSPGRPALVLCDTEARVPAARALCSLTGHEHNLMPSQVGRGAGEQHPKGS